VKIYKDQNSIDNKEEPIMIVHISDGEYKLWYKEMMRRFREKEDEVYDVDEAFECDKMSLSHYKEMLRFLNK